jgi:hypothetical protein
MYGESFITVPTYALAVHLIDVLPRRPPACTYKSQQQRAPVNINDTQMILTRSKMPLLIRPVGASSDFGLPKNPNCFLGLQRVLPSCCHVCPILFHPRAPLLLLFHGNVCPSPSTPPFPGVLMDTNLSGCRLNSRDHLCNAVHTSAAFATFSVSLTAPTTRPGATGNTTSNVSPGAVRVGLNKNFKTMTVRFTEGGGISDGTLDSVADRHEDKPLPLNILPKSDQVVAPIPPPFDRSSGLPPSHV